MLCHITTAISALQIWPCTCISYSKMIIFTWDISNGGNITTYSGKIAFLSAACMLICFQASRVSPIPATSVKPSSLSPGKSPECTTTCTNGLCSALAVFLPSKNGIFYIRTFVFFMLSQLQKSVLCNLPNVRSWGLSNKGKKDGKKKRIFFLPFIFPQLFLTSFSKVTASIQVLAESDNPQIPIILSNFSNIVSHNSLGVRFITEGYTITFIIHFQSNIFPARGGH